MWKEIQLAVIRDAELLDEVKLEMIKMLQHEKEMAEYREKKAAEEAKKSESEDTEI